MTSLCNLKNHVHSCLFNPFKLHTNRGNVPYIKFFTCGKKRSSKKCTISSQVRRRRTNSSSQNYKNEPRHEISNNVVCATSKGSDQPAHTRRLIRAFASRLTILWVLATDRRSFGVSKLKRRPHRLVWVYTCQNATLLEITCHGSNVKNKNTFYTPPHPQIMKIDRTHMSH